MQENIKSNFSAGRQSELDFRTAFHAVVVEDHMLCTDSCVLGWATSEPINIKYKFGSEFVCDIWTSQHLSNRRKQPLPLPLTPALSLSLSLTWMESARHEHFTFTHYHLCGCFVFFCIAIDHGSNCRPCEPLLSLGAFHSDSIRERRNLESLAFHLLHFKSSAAP